MKVLSLFDGCSGAMLALKEAGISVTSYDAFEIDKYAIQVSKANFPEIIQHGDVRNIAVVNQTLGYFDLLIGGSPCQDLSIAGKRKGFDGERSGLFWEYVKCLRLLKPKYFLLENVASMSKENKRIITEVLGVEPILINSSLLTAQNRKRLYWTNIQGIEQPADKGILLKNILESREVHNSKSKALSATYYKGVSKSYVQKRIVEGKGRGIRQLVFKKQDGCIEVGHAADIKGRDILKRVYSPEGKSPTLTAVCGGHQEKKVAIRDKSKTVRSSGLKSFDRHEWDSISNCHYRKLTPLECERLQGMPDNYTDAVSNTQRYKMIGNGFTIPVIAHILRGLKNE